jgi:ribosome-interacting GTPase 1
MMTDKVGIVEPEETAVAMQRMGKHASAATNQHAAIEELLEMVFYMQSVERLYTRTKEKSLQNKVLCTTENFPRCTPVRELHTAFNLLYTRIYDYNKTGQATSRGHAKS